MLIYLLKNLHQFLKYPRIIENKQLDMKLFIKAFREFIIFDLVLCFFWGIISSILFNVFDDYANILKNRSIFFNPYLDRWVFVIFIAPLLEEFGFRLGLVVTKLNIALNFAIQLLLLFTVFGFIQATFHIRLLYMSFAFLLFYYLLKKRHLLRIKKNYKLLVYWNIIIFGLLHLFNYNYSNNTDYLFIPFLISLQLVLGIYLSYSRLKYGMIYAIFIHIFHNTFFYFLSVLAKIH